MAHIVLITGGCRSGKSDFALHKAEQITGGRLFVATSPVTDVEMAERIRKHKEAREKTKWQTIEEEVEIAQQLDLNRDKNVILIDCLTLWINNLFMKYDNSIQHINDRIGDLIEVMNNLKGVTILVSNEVGMGIVPENQLARAYRDVAGSLNQRIAAIAGKVVAVIAGIPMVLKDE